MLHCAVVGGCSRLSPRFELETLAVCQLAFSITQLLNGDYFIPFDAPPIIIIDWRRQVDYGAGGGDSRKKDDTAN